MTSCQAEEWSINRDRIKLTIDSQLFRNLTTELGIDVTGKLVSILRHYEYNAEYQYNFDSCCVRLKTSGIGSLKQCQSWV